MRVLLHSRSFYPRLGGVEQCSLVLATELTRLGHEVVVATDVEAPASVDALLTFEVIRGKSRHDLAKAARRSDVVHANGFSVTTTLFALPARRPIVFTHHGYQAACLAGLGWHEAQGFCDYDLRKCVALTMEQCGPARAIRQLARHPVGRAALHVARANVSVSEFVARTIRAPASRVVMNCVDTSVLRPGPAGPRERFLFVGRFVAEKGIDTLFRGISMAGHDVAVDLVGAGPLEGEYRNAVKRLGLGDRVRFLGPKRGEDLAQAIRDSLAVVVPSVWDEAFGIVAAEALCCGRLALVSNRGGLPEAVEGVGTTFAAGDALEIARLMRRVIDDRGWREDLEKRLPAAASRFAPARMAREYLAVYREACV